MRTVSCKGRLLGGGCLPRGCLPAGCLPGGLCIPACTEADTLNPWTEWLTDRCKNITFPHLRLRAAINVTSPLRPTLSVGLHKGSPLYISDLYNHMRLFPVVYLLSWVINPFLNGWKLYCHDFVAWIKFLTLKWHSLGRVDTCLKKSSQIHKFEDRTWQAQRIIL